MARSTRAIVRASFHRCAHAAVGVNATPATPHAARGTTRAANRGRMNGRSSDATGPATGLLMPVWRDILLDTETAVAAYARGRRRPLSFLLESAPAGSETWARYTFLGSQPRGAWRLTEGVVEDWDATRGWNGARRPDDPIAELGAFWGGAVGYFGYDVVRHIERLPDTPPRGVRAPDALFVFTDALVIIDNLRARARVVSAMRLSRGASA